VDRARGRHPAWAVHGQHWTRREGQGNGERCRQARPEATCARTHAARFRSSRNARRIELTRRSGRASGCGCVGLRVPVQLLSSQAQTEEGPREEGTLQGQVQEAHARAEDSRLAGLRSAVLHAAPRAAALADATGSQPRRIQTTLAAHWATATKLSTRLRGRAGVSRGNAGARTPTAFAHDPWWPHWSAAAKFQGTTDRRTGTGAPAYHAAAK
jgi:hypothetical protein